MGVFQTPPFVFDFFVHYQHSSDGTTAVGPILIGKVTIGNFSVDQAFSASLYIPNCKRHSVSSL